MKKASLLFLIFLLLSANASAAPVRTGIQLSPDAEDALADVLVRYAADLPHAARVGIATVIAREAEAEQRGFTPGSPDAPVSARAIERTAAGFAERGAFGEDPGPSALSRIFDAAADLLPPPLTPFTRRDPDSARLLAESAVRAAERGADPSRGADSFRIVRLPRTGDFDFDDTREDEERKKIAETLEGCGVVIGRVGFGR